MASINIKRSRILFIILALTLLSNLVASEELEIIINSEKLVNDSPNTSESISLDPVSSQSSEAISTNVIDLDEKEQKETPIHLEIISLSPARPWEEQLSQGSSQVFQYTQMSEDDSLVFYLKKSLNNHLGRIKLLFKRNGIASIDDKEYEKEFTQFGDYCIIDHSYIQNKQEIIGTIHCVQTPCEFLLQIQQSTPAKLEDELNILFNENTVQILDFQLPSNYNRTHVYFQIVKSQSDSDEFAKVDRFDANSLILIGSHYSSFYQELDYGIMSFYGGSNTGSSCQDCNVRVIMNFPLNTELVVQRLVFTDTTEIDPENFQFDINQNDEISNSYQISLQQFQSPWDYISIDVIFFSPEQHTTLIVADTHPIAVFNQKNTYPFYSEFKISELVEESDKNNDVSPIGNLFNIDQTLNQTSDIIYFNIQSNSKSPYNLDIKILSFKAPETMKIDLQQIISVHLNTLELMNFVLEVPEGKQGMSQQVAIALRSLTGESRFYVTNCSDENCSNRFSPDHFRQDNPVSLPPLVAQTKLFDQNKEEIIVFNSNCQKSFVSGLENYCYYVLGVRGMGINVQNSILIQATFDDSETLPLKENEGFSVKIRSAQTKYFQFIPQSTDNLEYVEFKISSPHVIMYISSEEKCQSPSPDCNQIIGSSFNPALLSAQNFKSNHFYIGVKSFYDTDFVITAEVIRQSTLKIVKLVEAVPYKGQITQTTPSSFFSFEVDLPEDDQIEFNLRAPKNKVMLLVSANGNIPDNLIDGNGADWVSHSGHLYIKKSDKQFKRKATYYVSVWAKDHAFTNSPHNKVERNENHMQNNERDTDSLTFEFSLMVSTDKSIQLLEYNEPFYDIVLPQSDKMYQIHVDPSINFLIINRQFTNIDGLAPGDVIFYIGVTPSNRTQDYLIKIDNYKNGGYLLKSKELDQLCGNSISDDDDDVRDEVNQNEQGTSINMCSIFLAVDNVSKKKIAYTVSATLINLATQLKDGHQNTFTLSHVNGAMNFFYKPSHYDHPLNLYLYSYYGRTVFTALLWENQDQLPITQWPFPSSELDQHQAKYNFVSAIHNSHSMTVVQEALSACKPNCIILVSVSFMEEDHYTEEQSHNGEDTFVLIASSLYTEIANNQKLEFSLHDTDSKFFFYDLSRLLAKKANLILAMTTLSGRAIIKASVSDNKKERYPSIAESDFVAYGNYLSIQYDELVQLMEAQELSVKENPILIIDVFSIMGTGKFVLTLFTSDSKFIEVMHGLPQEIHVAENQSVIFKYFNYFQSGFKVKLMRETGWADLQISICQTEDINGCLEDEQILLERHIAGQSSSTIHIMPEDKELFCTYCTYFIHLIAEKNQGEFHGHINVLLDDDVIWLQESRSLIDSLDGQQQAIYRLSVPPQQYIYVSLVSFSGSPEVYVNYHFDANYSNYEIGPFKKNLNSTSLNFRVTPRDQMIKDGGKDFHPYNRPVATDGVTNSSPLDLTDFMLENEIFILVINQNQNPTNYSISFSGGDKIRYISDGQILSGSLAKNTNNSFIYYHLDENLPTLLTVYLENSLNLNALDIRIQRDDMEDHLDYDDLTTQKVPLSILSRHDNSIVFSLPKETGGYFIVVKNNGTDSFNYTISLNAQDITLVPFGQKIQHALMHGSINYYEFFVPAAGFIALQFIHCAGDISIATTQDYNNLLSLSAFDQQEDAAPGHSNIRTYNVESGAFYLLIISPNITDTTVKGVPDNTAFYSITARWYQNKESIPQIQLVPGNDGIVDFVRSQGDKAVIHFKPLRCLNCYDADFKSAQVTYQVIWSIDEEILNVMGKCDAKVYFEHVRDQLAPNEFAKRQVKPNELSSNIQMETFTLNFDTTQTIEASIVVDSENIYFATIKATVSGFPQITYDFPVFYENVQLGIPQSYIHDGNFYLVAAGASVLVIAFCFATFYFYGQFRRATKVSSYMKASNPHQAPGTDRNNFEVVNNSDTTFRIELNDFTANSNQQGYDNLNED